MEHRPEDPLNQNKGKFHTNKHFSLEFFFRLEFSLDHFHPDLGHSGVNQLGGAFVNGRPLPESERIFFYDSKVMTPTIGYRGIDRNRELVENDQKMRCKLCHATPDKF